MGDGPAVRAGPGWGHDHAAPGKEEKMTQNAQQVDAHDEAEIRSVLLGYVEALDGRDFDRLAEAFTATAELVNTFEGYIPGGDDFTGVLATGDDGIAKAVGALMSPLDATQHFLGAIWLEPTEEECARARR
nr:hypothetical protein GCM10025730_05920 [Promicromonospora thailandica]